MPRISFTLEEVKEAAEAIPAGWGWHNLAMVNSDPTMGHKVHHSHAVTLVKVGVIGRVPSSGDPQEHRQGPWYGVTKLGQLVAEAVGLRLVKEDAEGSPCVGCPGTGGDGTCMDHDREQCGSYQAWAHGKTLVSLNVKAFMDLDEDVRARVCMEAGLDLPDYYDQIRGKTGWLTVLGILDGNAELTLKVSHLVQQERDKVKEDFTYMDPLEPISGDSEPLVQRIWTCPCGAVLDDAGVRPLTDMTLGGTEWFLKAGQWYHDHGEGSERVPAQSSVRFGEGEGDLDGEGVVLVDDLDGHEMEPGKRAKVKERIHCGTCQGCQNQLYAEPWKGHNTGELWWSVVCQACQLQGHGKIPTEAMEVFNKALQDNPPEPECEPKVPNSDADDMDEESKEQFRSGWKLGAEDVIKGKDQTKYGRVEDLPVWSDWFYCGYNSAHNKWNGNITRYVRLASALACEALKGPKTDEG